VRARAALAAISILICIAWHPVMGQRQPSLRNVLINIDRNGVSDFRFFIREHFEVIELDRSCFLAIHCRQVSDYYGHVDRHILSKGIIRVGLAHKFVDLLSRPISTAPVYPHWSAGRQKYGPSLGEAEAEVREETPNIGMALVWACNPPMPIKFGVKEPIAIWLASPHSSLERPYPHACRGWIGRPEPQSRRRSYLRP
jgi:hypothetical protein